MQYPKKRTVLFLQGPLSPLYKKLGKALMDKGIPVLRLNFSFGDALFWRLNGATSYRGKLSDFRQYIADFLVAHNVTDIIVHGDRRVYHKIAIEEAKRLNLYICVSELGLLRPDWMTFERNGLSIHSHFPDRFERIEEIYEKVGQTDLTPRFQTSFFKVAAPDIFYNLINTFFWFLYPHYKRHTVYFPPLEYLAHGVRLFTKARRDKKVSLFIEKLKEEKRDVFLFPLQLQGDFQLRDNAPFDDMAHVFDFVFSSFKQQASPNAVLVLKTHPLDNGLDGWMRLICSYAKAYQLEEQVFFADGGTLYEMAHISKGVVTVNSTAGFDMVCLGLPVKTLSPTLFTFESVTDLKPLDEFWQNPQKPDEEKVSKLQHVLAATVQTRGTIYDDVGLETLVETMVERLLDKRLNEPNAFEKVPPRLKEFDRLKKSIVE